MSARTHGRLEQGGSLSVARAPYGGLQRKCACDRHTAAGAECARCGRTAQALQRASLSARRTQTTEQVPSIVQEVLKAPGQPLDRATRAFMEPRFGVDFSKVRVHADAKAADSARSVGALAYAVGQDVVLGAGRYAPGTAEGLGLLAHELTHVVQQGGTAGTPQAKPAGGDTGDASEHEADRNAEAVRHDFPRFPAPTPAPPAAQAWAGCAAEKTGQLGSDLADAVSWVSQAISDAQAAGRPARTTGALGRYLSTDPAHVSGTILPKLQTILTELKRGASNFRCQTEAQCLQVFKDGANAYSGHPITLCPGYFEIDSLGRPTTLIHEAGHNAGLRGNVVEWQPPFPGLDVRTRLGNTESYAAFVRSNQYPALAPLQEPTGFQYGTGALLPGGGAAPRFVVTVGLDTILKQRILHFFDLRLGARVDVDTSGSILGTVSLGARAFAPVSVSRTPLYLDLRTGLVLGRAADVGPRFENIAPLTEINVLGPSGGAAVGFLRGKFGGSIEYRYIWNLVKNNPDLHEVTINGEIRF